MTNAVYTTTVHALSGVVSARAAETMLHSLLREQYLTPETVTVQDIQRILAGPLLTRLSMVLPEARARQELLALSRELDAEYPKAPTLFTHSGPLAAWDDGSDDSGLPLNHLSLDADDFEFDDPEYMAVGPGQVHDLGNAAGQEALLRELARLSGVQGVMLCRASGEVLQSRSVSGAVGLGGVVAATALLLRGRTLRLLSVDLGDRTVCMRPLGDYCVAVVVGAQANVGRLLVELQGLEVAA
ncbi:roadblock/LC7 domain-containing protein [Deinococcus arenicola]|uniref:Roadblock/LC7 domain-containing protein n=1 Tax=Deinococcus arenicola TaxID=2994950 RepID=A0ABU4DKU8_9DEIO|nr:roadblock/LC7 domain-containing protein [Deinococcus sp. ZS9-10]MDV6373059.1 roadblock/LC7 domain-containing protein [Deinococcus sp. ZS9-10]